MRPYRGVNGLVLDDENMTLGEYLDSWLSGSVQQSTYDGYEIAVKVHIKPLSAGRS